MGVFEDMASIECRAFGGPERVEMLRLMLEGLRACRVGIAVVSRNSKHVIRKTLDHLGLLDHIARDMIYGFEDYGDDMPKSRVVRQWILPALNVPEDAVLFVDDDRANVLDVRENCPDAKVLRVADPGLSA